MKALYIAESFPLCLRFSTIKVYMESEVLMDLMNLKKREEGELRLKYVHFIKIDSIRERRKVVRDLWEKRMKKEGLKTY